ncbi:unnamed protein product [Polarella glacialis]|uniref:NYN domain-containing protein n=2 Tax=Polarella glacialis TaxID=89957 RepID=A0A813ELE5_POLGL|nr:unnamed protein product [Polarella glacialis]
MLDACRGRAAARAARRNVCHRNANFGLLLLVWLVSLTSLKNNNYNNNSKNNKTQTATSDCLTRSSSKVRPEAVALCTPSLQRSGEISRLRRERIVARQAVEAAAVAIPASRRRGRRTTTKLPTQGATTAATSGRRQDLGSNMLAGDARSPIVKAKPNKSRGEQAARGSLTTTVSKQIKSKAKVSASKVKQPNKHDETALTSNTAASIETATVRNASAAAATAAPGTEQGLLSDVHEATFPRIALLIDGDQVGKNAFTPILDSLRQCGQVVDRRAYLSEHTARMLEEDLNRHQIRPVIVRRHIGGTKSPVDMEIAMDVLGLCNQSQGDKVAGVAIASNDLDFFEVLERAKSQGLKVWLCMKDTFGGTGPLARRAAADAGAQIILYGQRKQELPKMVSLISIHDGIAKSHGIRPVHHDLRGLADFDSLSLSLRQCGYLSANQGATTEGAMVKFFHVNKLGPLIIDPISIGLHQCLAAFQNNASATWSTNPGNLIYVRPRGRKKYPWGTIIGQGPFIIQDSTQLVPEILDRLGYWSPELNFQETIDMFWDGNINFLKMRGVSVATVEGAQRLEVLEREFRLDLPQNWHPARSDSSLREFLLDRGFLVRKDALREEVQHAIKEFLQSRGQSVPPKRSYLQLVADILSLLTKNDPSRRK